MRETVYPTATDQLIAVAYEMRSLAAAVRACHDPARDPEGYAAALIDAIAGPRRSQVARRRSAVRSAMASKQGARTDDRNASSPRSGSVTNTT